MAGLTSNPDAARAAEPLSGEQLAFLKTNGFLALDRITSPEDVAEIRDIVISLFERKAGHDQGAHFNFAGAEGDKDAPNIPQIIGALNFAGRLRDTEFRRNAAQLAKQVLGPEARFHIDHTLVKPPEGGAPTPWHQDEAFKDPNYDYAELSIWMPLQPVNDVNGCMAFIPGSHLAGVLPHRTPGDDPRVHALECCDGFDPASAVSCPLPAGGCTLHYGRTLHGAGPNRSGDPRYAYVLIYQLAPVPAKTPRSFPWLKGKSTARMERQGRWLQGGGKLVQLWRTVRNKELHDYKRTLLKLKRKSLGALFPGRRDKDV